MGVTNCKLCGWLIETENERGLCDKCLQKPKSFLDMTSDEIRNYEGPVYSYSVGFKNIRTGAKIPHDGDCTSQEEANRHVEDLIAHYYKRQLDGWRLDYNPRFYPVSYSKKKTTERDKQ